IKTVLFVCVENSFRSQIAEAFFNKIAPKGWVAISAGSRPADKIHPNAIILMKEKGIDISQKKPKLLTKDLQKVSDVAVIVCGGNECPIVYASYVEEWNFPYPAKMSLEEARKIRDAIEKKVVDLVSRLDSIASRPSFKLNSV
ncbi:MAG: arsenate reductase ArsC, partial [Thermoproteota archaeon]